MEHVNFTLAVKFSFKSTKLSPKTTDMTYRSKKPKEDKSIVSQVQRRLKAKKRKSKRRRQNNNN